MNCLEFYDRINQMLDGATDGYAADATAHLAECSGCRELAAAARLMSTGLTAIVRPQSSVLLTQSIVAGVLDERRQRLRRVRQRVAVTFALAASIVILMLVGWLGQSPRPGQSKIAQQPAVPQEPAAPKIGQSADEARVAVAAFTERFADQTKEQAKLLMAAANKIDLAPMASLPDLNDLQQPLDPAAKSLRHATQTVASGIEPIANSARRAFTFFVKELPAFDLPARN